VYASMLQRDFFNDRCPHICVMLNVLVLFVAGSDTVLYALLHPI
jgi:hypothetical protein